MQAGPGQGATRRPALAGVFSSFNINVPQLYADLDRTKAKQLGVAVQDVFDTMQIYLGSLYVNDFNRFGRTYQVIAQADTPVPLDSPRTSCSCKTRNDEGEMVPLGAVVECHARPPGPTRAMRYNGYPAADINGGPAPGYSTGQAQAAIDQDPRRDPAQGHGLSNGPI